MADVARALVMAIGREGTYNIATGVETSVQRVYELARSALPDSSSPEATLAPLRPGELQASCLDISLAGTRLGWQPEIPLDAGLSSAVLELAAA